MKKPHHNLERHSPTSRLHAVAAIFAKAILRMHERRILPPKESAENGDERLDVSAETVLSGEVG